MLQALNVPRRLAVSLVFTLVLFPEADAVAGEKGMTATPACDQVFVGQFESALPQLNVIANAGSNIDSLAGTATDLSGSGQNAQNFCWTLHRKPAGSNATLINRDSATVRVLTDLAGDYGLNLLVDDGQTVSTVDAAVLSTRRNSASVGVAGGQVVSGDRQVTLTIPPGALSQDTEITVKRLLPEELPPSLVAADPLATYEFGPDGLVFSIPATFVATFNPVLPGSSAGSGQPVLLANVSGSQVELAGQMTTVLEDNQMKISGQIAHFSTLSLLPQRAVQVDQDPAVFGLEFRPIKGNYSVRASGADPVTVTTNTLGTFAVGPIEVNPQTGNPLLADLTHDSVINLSHPTTSQATASFSGRCLRAGVGEVELQLLVNGGRIVSLPGMAANASLVILRFPVRCFAPQVLNLPRASDDLATREGQSAINIPVLANDVTTGVDLSSVTVERSPGVGAAIANADGSITYIPQAGFVLLDSFDYFFRNTFGQRSNTATVFITPLAAPNQLPEALDDSAVTPQDQPLDIAILANDRDSDSSLDPASVNLMLAGTSGQVVLNGDGSVTYTAGAGFSGVDQFGYTVADTNGARSNVAQVRVTVNPVSGPPQAVNDQLLVPEGQVTELNVLANDTGNIDPFSLSIVQEPISGSVEVILRQNATAKGLQSGPGSLTAVIEYTPAPDFTGDDFLTYGISDPSGQIQRSALARIAVAPADNQPPVALDDMASTTPGVPITIFATLNDVDFDSLLDRDSLRVLTTPDNGQVSNGGPGAVIYSPDTGFIGIDQFTYDIADAFQLRSNVATISVTVAPLANEPPVALDDAFTLGINSAPLSLSVVANDTDADGNLDLSSIVITQPPGVGGSVSLDGNGRVRITPDPDFTGTFSFLYTITDGIDVSNAATVTVNVRTFLGTDRDPTDNVSAANTTFLSFFGDAYIDNGTGASVGVFHNKEFPGSIAFIDDYTVLFVPAAALLTSDSAVDDTLDFSTPNQTFSATYNSVSSVFQFDNLAQGSVFSDFGPDTLTVSSVTAGSFSVDPPAPIREPDGQLKEMLGEFRGLETQIIIPPDAAATHLVVRLVGKIGGSNGSFAGVNLRVPLDTLSPAPDGSLSRPLLTQAARTLLNAVDFKASFSALVLLYNQVENTAFFDFPGARPVPLAAGRGFLFPSAQLNPPARLCQNVRKFSLCQGGPNPRILATNANGTIDVFDSTNGDFVTNIVGESIPNFTVTSGWHTVQDPVTNCLLVSDSGNSTGGAIHQYDTDGKVVTANFIDLPVLGGARGLAWRNGNLLAAVHTQGEIREFNAVTGEFLSTVIDDLDRPNYVYVDQGNNLYVSDQGASGFNDVVYFYPANGSPRVTAIGGGLATPYQIARLQNGNLGLAHFGGGSVRAFSNGFPLIANLLLGNNPDNGMEYQIRGLAPLSNGSFLVSADNSGGVAVFDPFNAASGGYDLRRDGSTFRFLSNACLNF